MYVPLLCSLRSHQRDTPQFILILGGGRSPDGCNEAKRSCNDVGVVETLGNEPRCCDLNQFEFTNINNCCLKSILDSIVKNLFRIRPRLINGLFKDLLACGLANNPQTQSRLNYAPKDLAERKPKGTPFLRVSVSRGGNIFVVVYWVVNF